MDGTNHDLFSAGKAGWEVMGIYCKALSPHKASKDEKAFQFSTHLMTKVVRGY